MIWNTNENYFSIRVRFFLTFDSKSCTINFKVVGALFIEYSRRRIGGLSVGASDVTYSLIEDTTRKYVAEVANLRGVPLTKTAFEKTVTDVFAFTILTIQR